MGYTWTLYVLDPAGLLDRLARADVGPGSVLGASDPHRVDLAARWPFVAGAVAGAVGRASGPGLVPPLTAEEGHYVARVVERLGQRGATVPHSTPAGDEFREDFLAYDEYFWRVVDTLHAAADRGSGVVATYL
ncbi:MAG TPA: hypothetical protein P5181_03560 [Dermatophilaceae bacterium]|nr:hypothetical protein [Dermatophilaceae bacterium]